jgi:SAM-dependent methyltransferase
MQLLSRLYRRFILLPAFKLKNADKQNFTCPVCKYMGPFEDVNPFGGYRKHAKCPACGALERHRLQYLVACNILQKIQPAQLRMLHFAPEPFFRAYFASQFQTYETADIDMPGVDHSVDIQSLPFADATYDFVFASHVLEHVRDDNKSVQEIRRVLKPGGIAILPVPIIAPQTVEYPEPNPHEAYHMRAPGADYYARYESHFSRIETFLSESFDARYQLFIYEDRMQFPNEHASLRPAMQGEKHTDIVPVCYV